MNSEQMFIYFDVNKGKFVSVFNDLKQSGFICVLTSRNFETVFLNPEMFEGFIESEHVEFLREFVFDGNKKLFIYRKSFFFFKSRSVYGRYSDVDAITISYFFKPNKSSGVMMTVILKNGKNVETENFDPKLYSQRIEVINNKAKELADTIGCRFLPGEPGKRVVSTIKANGTIFYEYEPAKTRY
ncbi:hypothetical protein EOM81_11410 [bacterium]|nr:hypothetical protein [bacterium]